MTDVQVQTAAQREVVLTALTNLWNGDLNEAIACFSDGFQFNDWGIGLEFKDKERLAEFFRKIRELYPDSSFETHRIHVGGDDVIAEWTLEAILQEPYWGALPWKVPITLHGVSIVRVDDGKIADWADYYDGLTSRRTALAAHFTEWIEY